MSSGELSLEEVQKWRVDALKTYCRNRDLKVSGGKPELVARVFAASEMGIQEAPTAKERIIKTESEKAKLLITSKGISLPDPLSLKNWLGESDAMSSWPPIFLNDVTVFLMADHPGKDVKLHERVLNEYKEGKAYRLFDSGWLKEVFFHPIENDSEYCFLKAKCTHTMKISDTPHTAWISAVKKTGRIVSAYCTCVAGMSSSCIHVTALLFRVEAANRSGLTNPACTSQQCTWNVPADKTTIQPTKLSDMEWKASKLNKKPKRPGFDTRRKLFQPVQKKQKQNDAEKRKMMYGTLKNLLPDSCFVMMNDAEYEEDILRPLHVSIPSDNSNLTTDEINEVEKATIGQSQNEEWHAQRKGRITASNFYKVHTKVEKLKDTKKVTSATKLVDELLGRNAPPEHLPALKYGRNMESIAKQKYIKLFEKEHKDTSYRECGIFIYEKDNCLGASPDLLLECSCCGKSVLEVKCPYSVANETPSPHNLSYLVFNDCKVMLKKNHRYYAQVQGQLAITKRKICHFLVYTQKGQHQEIIQFDASYWQKLEKNLTYFFVNHVAPAMKSTKNLLPRND